MDKLTKVHRLISSVVVVVADDIYENEFDVVAFVVDVVITDVVF